MSMGDLISALPIDKRVITSYDDTGFRIQEKRYEEAIMVFGDHILSWNVQNSQEISLESLSPILDLEKKPEFILIGSGRNIGHPPEELKAALKKQAIGLEYMNTISALNTWPILLMDGRYVAGCFLPAACG